MVKVLYKFIPLERGWIQLILLLLLFVRYWSVVLCGTTLTHLSDFEVKVTDFEIAFYSFGLNFLEFQSLKVWTGLVDTMPVVRY